MTFAVVVREESKAEKGGNGHDFENSFDIFYLTREEAEKALKEREKK